MPFRGATSKLRPERRSLVRGLIYPVPDPRLPFLGVHLTRHVSGDVLVGPTALLAPNGRARCDGRARGAWRGDGGAPGSPRSASPRAARASHAPRRGTCPELTAQRTSSPRSPACARRRSAATAQLVDDFVFSRTEHALHVRNAPSPAATSAFAIARVVADDVMNARS